MWIAQVEITAAGLPVNLARVDPVQPMRVMLRASPGAQLGGLAERDEGCSSLAELRVPAGLPGQQHGFQGRGTEVLDLLAGRSCRNYGVMRLPSGVAVNGHVGQGARAEPDVTGSLGRTERGKHVARGFGRNIRSRKRTTLSVSRCQR